MARTQHLILYLIISNFLSNAFITEIYKSVLEKHKHVIGIYTARHSSWHSRSRRIRQASEPNDLKADTDKPTESEQRRTGVNDNEQELETTTEKPSTVPSQNEEEGEREEDRKDREESSTPAAPALVEDENPNTQVEKIDYDKEIYMTIPIFSGLMVTTLMLIILAIGVTAISEIKSNSRFDDPKGKALVIPNE